MAAKASLSLWAKLTRLKKIDVCVGTQAAHDGAHGVPAGTFTQPMVSVFVGARRTKGSCATCKIKTWKLVIFLLSRFTCKLNLLLHFADFASQRLKVLLAFSHPCRIKRENLRDRRGHTHTHKHSLNFVTHTESFTHNFVTHTHTFSHNFVTHNLSHTIFAWQAWHLWHWAGSGVACGAAALCMAGVALGDVAGMALGDMPVAFAWQVWHLATSTFPLCDRRGTYGTGLDLGSPVVPRHFAWQAWRLATKQASHLATCKLLLCGRRGTWQHRPSLCMTGVALGDIHMPFAWQAWHLWHWVGSGGALGPLGRPWHRATLRGRRGTWRHRPSLLRGRRGTQSHPRCLCVAGVALTNTQLFHTHYLHTTLSHTHTTYIRTHAQLCYPHTHLLRNILSNYWCGMHRTCKNTSVKPDRNGLMIGSEKLCEEIFLHPCSKDLLVLMQLGQIAKTVQ